MEVAPKELFRPGGPFFFVAGPCVLEDRELNLRIAERVAEVGRRLSVPAVFKASFDKANRTSVASPRGPGLEEGLERLAEVGEATGLPLLTDIHEPSQAGAAAEVVDVLQVPAFLCRQTDLLLAAGGSGRAVNLKKGQWMAPEQMAHAAEKVREGGGERMAVTERGTMFGYGRWLVDMRSFEIMRERCACPAIYDATHSVQLPGGGGSSSGGEPRFIEPLARAAVAAGADAVYVEVHLEPRSAPSDAATMLPIDRLEPLLSDLLRIRAARERPSETAGAAAGNPGRAGAGA